MADMTPGEIRKAIMKAGDRIADIHQFLPPGHLVNLAEMAVPSKNGGPKTQCKINKLFKLSKHTLHK